MGMVYMYMYTIGFQILMCKLLACLMKLMILSHHNAQPWYSSYSLKNDAGQVFRCVKTDKDSMQSWEN